ncbi:hypothetical protein CHI02_23950, partial [Niallia circulans]
MAYIDGKWLDREARQARIDLLKERVLKIRKLYEAGNATESHIDIMMQDAAELKKLNRVHRAE